MSRRVQAAIPARFHGLLVRYATRRWGLFVFLFVCLIVCLFVYLFVCLCKYKRGDVFSEWAFVSQAVDDVDPYSVIIDEER